MAPTHTHSAARIFRLTDRNSDSDASPANWQNAYRQIQTGEYRWAGLA